MIQSKFHEYVKQTVNMSKIGPKKGAGGKAKQGRLQGKTNSAEPRQSKPGSRAKSGNGTEVSNQQRLYDNSLQSYKNVYEGVKGEHNPL